MKKDPGTDVNPTEKQPECGLVMPISEIDGYSAEHWLDVKAILTAALTDSGFAVSLVSDADEVGVIQRRIVQNLYQNALVVCDVSGKNPNVMFELGLRLAFDKPTIIVKDDITAYSFDTAPIEHLTYPRDLRYAKILAFKASLAAKAEATLSKAKDDPSFSTFLKHFGEFERSKLEASAMSSDDVILEELRDLRRLLLRRDIPDRVMASPVRARVRPSEYSPAEVEQAVLLAMLALRRFGKEGEWRDPAAVRRVVEKQTSLPSPGSSISEYIQRISEATAKFSGFVEAQFVPGDLSDQNV